MLLIASEEEEQKCIRVIPEGAGNLSKAENAREVS